MSCKQSRQTDRQTDRQTERQTETETETDRHIQLEKDRMTDTLKNNSRKSVTWSAVPDAPKLVYVGMRL